MRNKKLFLGWGVSLGLVWGAGLLFGPAAAAEQTASNPSDWTIYIAPDACSDYTWGYDEQPTRRAYADVVRAHLDEMQRTDHEPAENKDHYNLSITQEATAFVEYYPDRKDELIERIKEGRVAIGPDYNNSLWGFLGTEGTLRTLYPSRRLDRDWGIPSNTVAEHIEEPALPWGMATILAGSGYRWLIAPFLDYDSTFSKLTNPPLFVWEGPDGSRIRVVMDDFASEKVGYTQGSHLAANPARIVDEWLPHYQQLAGYPLHSILAAGTHGDNGPINWRRAQSIAEDIMSYNAQPGPHAKLVNATYPMFCAAVDQAKPALPVLRGDFGISWDVWPVTLANYAAAGRMGSKKYLSAETLLAVAALQNPAASEATRQDRVKAEWDWIMIADHGWNGTDAANRQENARLRSFWSGDLNRRADILIRKGWSAAGLTADAGHLAVFNPLSWARAELVRVEIPETVSGVETPGHAISAQVTEEDGKRILSFVSPKIGAYGFQTFSLTAEPVKNESKSGLRAGKNEIENSLYRLRLDPVSGGIASLIDKSTGKDVVTAATGYNIGQTVFFDDKDHLLTHVKSEVVAMGPVLARIKTTGVIPDGAAGDIEVTAYTTLYAQLDRVDFDIRIHKPLSTQKQRLTQTFPVSAPGAVQHVEAIGAVLRPEPQPEGDLLPGADPLRFAVQGFVDTSLPAGPGVTVVPLESFALRKDLGGITFEALGNDQNYKEVSRDQDGQTEFRFRYALRPHSTKYDGADAAAWSRSFQMPLLVSFGQLAKAARPNIDLDAGRAVATAFKPAEASGALLRIWETSGRSGPISIGVPGYAQAFLTDLLESDLHTVPIREGHISIDLPANGFAAIRLVP